MISDVHDVHPWEYLSPAQIISLREQEEELGGSEARLSNPHELGAAMELVAIRRRLGDLEGARNLSKAVFVVGEQVMGHLSPVVLAARLELVRILLFSGNAQEAHEEGQRIVDAARLTLGPEDELTIEAESCLSTTFIELGDYPSALQLDRHVLAARLAHGGLVDPLTRRAMAGVIGLLIDLGLAEEAIDKSQLLRSEYQSDEVEDRCEAAEVDRLLMEAQYLRGDIEVLEVLDRAAATVSEQLGAEHRLSLDMDLLRIAALSVTGRLRLARGLFDSVVDRMASRFDADHPLTLDAGQAEVLVALLMGRFDEAVAVERSNLDALVSTKSALHPRAIETRSLLASCLQTRALVSGNTADFEEAKVLLASVAEDWQRVFGPMNPKTLGAKAEFGILLVRTGSSHDGLGLLHRTFKEAHAQYGEWSNVTVSAGISLMQGLAMSGEDPDQLRELVKILRSTGIVHFGEQHMLSVLSTIGDALILINEGHRAEGHAVLDRTFDLVTRTYGAGNLITTAFSNVIGQLDRP